MVTDLKNKFTEFIQNNQLINPENIIILGLSGGQDSMVLAHLLLEHNFLFEAAHCNFHLRGTSSDDDEIFVRNWCEKHRIKCHIKHFETENYAKSNKVSFEMAARDLRYNWFENLRKQQEAEAIVVAHHMNDQAETILMNLNRGTGFKGLKGMLPKQGKIVRPLIFASKEEIKQFSHQYNISYQNDHTNENINYKRNRIRHRIIPEFEQLNPSFIKTMQQNIERFQKVHSFVEYSFKLMEYSMVTYEGPEIIISLPTDYYSLIFHDFMKDFSSKNHISISYNEIQSILNSKTGKKIILQNHIIYKERKEIRIIPKNTGHTELTINSIPTIVKGNFYIFEIKYIANFDIKKLPKNKTTIWVDADKIKLPIQIQPWKPGQRITPLGMKGKKKVKNILTDAKIAPSKKEKYPVISDKRKIICIPGIIPDDEFRISDTTKKIIAIKMKEINNQ